MPTVTFSLPVTHQKPIKINSKNKDEILPDLIKQITSQLESIPEGSSIIIVARVSSVIVVQEKDC